MSNVNDFEIKNGVLVKYHGNDTEVVIPEGVTKIGLLAFAECKLLTNVKIPEGVTEIGEWAFWRCSSLTNITIPKGVTKIGEGAFCDSSITNVSIPEGVTEIGKLVFSYCGLLKCIDVDAKNSTYHIEGNCLIETASNKLVRGSLNSIIPNNVTEIGDYAFCGCELLTNITIPEGVAKIGERAFSDCSSLTNITIPESVTEIGEYAFSDCPLLERVVVLGDIKFNKDVFNGCKSLKMIIAPNAKVRHSAVCYRGFLEGFELFDKKKRASYIKGMQSHLDIAIEAVGGDGGAFKKFLDCIKPEGELFDLLLKLTTSQGKTELTAMLLEYGNSNGNKKSPLDDLKWD